MNARFGFGVAVSVAVATLAAALPAFVLILPGIDGAEKLIVARNFLFLSAAGNLVIGLPLGLTAYFVLKAQNLVSLRALMIAANSAAAVLALAIAAGLGLFGLVFFALPAAIAANVLAIAGWFWAARPTVQRDCTNA